MTATTAIPEADLIGLARNFGIKIDLYWCGTPEIMSTNDGTLPDWCFAAILHRNFVRSISAFLLWASNKASMISRTTSICFSWMVGLDGFAVILDVDKSNLFAQGYNWTMNNLCIVVETITKQNKRMPSETEK